MLCRSSLYNVHLASKVCDRFNKDTMGTRVLVMSTFCADGISGPQIVVSQNLA